MTKQNINIGTPNKGDGDPLRVAFQKINANFTELYNNSGGGGASVTVGDTAPTLPTEGSLWWDSTDGTLYIRYSNTWVDASPVATTIPDQTSNAGKYLTTNGTDLSWATVAGGANTGDLRFVSNAMYNLNGVVVENADLTHGATSALVLPVNGNTTIPAQLNNFYGDVTVIAGTDSSHTKSWTFASDGTTSFPTVAGSSITLQGSEFESLTGGARFGARDNVVIASNAFDTVHQWDFGKDGSLTFPSLASNNRTGSGENLKFAHSNSQKIISTSAGTADQNTVERLVIAGGDSYTNNGTWSGEGGDIYLWAGVGDDGGDIKVDAGNAYGRYGGTIKIRAGSSFASGSASEGGFLELRAGDANLSGGTGGPVNIHGGYGATHGVVNIHTAYNNTWTFGADGNLILPTNGKIKDANNYLTVENINIQGGLKDVTGATGSTGQILSRVSNGGVQWINNTSGPYNSITQSGKTLSIDENGVLAFPNTNTLDTGGPAFTIQSQNSITVKPNGNSFVFGADGNITFPDTSVQTTAFTGTGRIGFYNSVVYNKLNAGIALQPGFTVAGGTSTATLYIPSNSGADTTPADITNSGAGGVTITSGSTLKTWTFGADGGLTTPGTVVVAVPNINYLEAVYQEQLALLDAAFAADEYTGTGYPASKDSLDRLIRAQASNPLIPSYWITLAQSLNNAYYDWVNSKTTLHTTNNNGFSIATGDKQWQFDLDGNLTVPGNIVGQLDEDIEILTQSTSMTSPPGASTSTFKFGANGVLTLPDQTQLTSGGITVPYNETFTISTSYTAMSSPPGPQQRDFVFGANGLLTVPGAIQLPYGSSGIYMANTNIHDVGTVYFQTGGAQNQAYLGTANTSRVGGVQPDGTTITIDGAGVISAPAKLAVSTVGKTGAALAYLNLSRVLTVTNDPSNNPTDWRFPGPAGSTDIVIGDTTVTCSVYIGENGDLVLTVTGSSYGTVTVGDTAILSGTFGGNVVDNVTVTVATVSTNTPTAIDLTKSVNELTDGAYTLSDGVEGQVLYLTTQSSVTSAASILVTIANARNNGSVTTDYALYPFINRGLCSLLFNNGSWQYSTLPTTIIGNISGNAATATSATTATSALALVNGSTSFRLRTSAPVHSYGVSGDLLGDVFFNGSYIYYCKQNYVNNSTNVWVRSAWTSTSW